MLLGVICWKWVGLILESLSGMRCIFETNGLPVVAASELQSKHSVIKSGSFYRHSDGLILQRYFCKTCQRGFSSESLSPFKYQKKRFLNDTVFSLFASGVSQRRMAKLLAVNKKTIVRKFLNLGQICIEDMR